MARLTKYTVEIDLVNAAFDADPATEVARILAKLAYDIEHDGGLGPKNVFDINGNSVGHTTISWKNFPNSRKVHRRGDAG